VSQDHDGAAGPVLALGRDHSGLGAIPIYQRLGEARRAGTYEAHYLDEIRYLDGWVGRLFAQLDKLGSPGILLTADHGEAIGEDAYWFAHGHSVGLEQIRVPLLWRAPGGGGALVVPDPVSTIDVAPTLLRAAGIDRPAGFEGDPLVAGDESGRAEPSDRAIFAEHRLRAAVIAGDRYYARDRRALDEPLPDRITGGSLAPLAPRSAQLDPDGEQSPYQAERPTAAPLEPILQRFLDGSEAPVEPSPQAGSSATEEELRALGYLE